MKKKLISIVIVCIIVFSLIGCTITYDEINNEKEDANSYGAGYFTVVKQWGGVNDGTFRIVYANDTKVMYITKDTGYKFGISPLYNADGTLQVYDGD